MSSGRGLGFPVLLPGVPLPATGGLLVSVGGLIPATGGLLVSVGGLLAPLGGVWWCRLSMYRIKGSVFNLKQ